MNKPNDYDSVTAFSDYTPLAAGGYVCRIMQVQETTAQSSGAPMLKIGFDIAEGEEKGRFMNQFNANTRQDKKWPCVMNQLVYDSNGSNTTNKGFKTFNTCAEESNSGFKIQWGENYAACFKGKLIGVIFRREQFIGSDGKMYWSTKPYQIRSVETIRSGKYTTPEDKLCDNADQSNFPVPQTAAVTANGSAVDLSDFEEITSDSGLPF